MKPKTLSPAVARLYDEDFLSWTQETAHLLRTGRFDELDAEHLAEEIEDLGKSQRRELHSRLRTLLVHLLKWTLQPERRSPSWQRTMLDQRVELNELLRDSPSLRRQIPETIAGVYADAVQEASLETGLSADRFPGHCPFTSEQILDRGFPPR